MSAELDKELDAAREELTAGTWANINELAIWLHGQRDHVELRRGFVQRLAEVVTYDACMFDLCHEVDGHIEFFSPVSEGIPAKELAEYYRTYASQDYTTWSFNSKTAITYRDFDLIAPALRDTSPIYRGWLEPLGLYFGMGCTVVAGGVIFGSLTLFRNRDADDFSDADLAAVTELSRHLSVHFGLLWPGGVAQRGNGSADVTAREKDVLNLIAAGHTNREIAATLFISESTVKKHVNDIYRKFGVHNRIELAQALYAERGLHPTDPV